MTVKIFIDGAAGTTGLEIRDRLKCWADLSVVSLEGERRKDASAREDALNSADVAIFCLPDEAARAAVALIKNENVRVLDASSAHRTTAGWVYGFPELEPGQRAKIKAAKRVSNPGCYATSFIALVHPLVRAGIIPATWPATCNAVSGYSGGGRAMIAEFEDENSVDFTEEVVRIYGLSLAHKHVPEMQMHAGLAHPPIFAPGVGRFYRGMIVEVPLQLWALPKKTSLADVHAALAAHYRGEKLVEVVPFKDTAEIKALDAEELKNTNLMRLYVFGNEARAQARLVAALDNLGKGAAGAAIQNLNIMLGLDETAGLL